MDPKLQKTQLKAKDTAYNQFGAIGGAIGGAKLAQLRYLYAIEKESNNLIYITPQSLTEIISGNSELLEKYNGLQNKSDYQVMFNILDELNKIE